MKPEFRYIQKKILAFFYDDSSVIITQGLLLPEFNATVTT